MRKKLWLFAGFMAMMFASCGTNYIVTANYDVCYPDGTKTYTKSVGVKSYGDVNVVCHSLFGTNYISVVKCDNPVAGKDAIKLQHIEATTAPMRLNSFSVTNPKGRKVARSSSDDMY